MRQNPAQICRRDGVLTAYDNARWNSSPAAGARRRIYIRRTFRAVRTPYAGGFSTAFYAARPANFARYVKFPRALVRTIAGRKYRRGGAGRGSRPTTRPRSFRASSRAIVFAPVRAKERNLFEVGIDPDARAFVAFKRRGLACMCARVHIHMAAASNAGIRQIKSGYRYFCPGALMVARSRISSDITERGHGKREFVVKLQIRSASILSPPTSSPPLLPCRSLCTSLAFPARKNCTLLIRRLVNGAFLFVGVCVCV